MKIFSLHKIKNCLQSNNVVNILFDEEVSREFLDFIKINSTLDVYENFPKPYFSLTVKNKYILKGTIGNDIARMYLPVCR